MNLIIKYFSITKAFSDGINLYFKNLKLFLPITTIVGAVTLLILWATVPHPQLPYFNFESIFHKVRTTHTFYYSFSPSLKPGHVIGLILLPIYKAFMINFCLKIYDNTNNNNLSFYDFMNLDFDIFSYLIARLRYLFTSLAGILLLIIPGLVWIPRYYFSNYFIVDRKVLVGESFAASSVLAYGVKRKIWLFILIKGFLFNLFFIGLAPLTRLLVYLVLYVPFSILSKISIYRQLLTPKQIV